jgi:6-phosphofructokinase 1
MSELKGACIFGQSGGPTSAINASAAGVFQEALKQENITAVYGAAHGIKGILEENFYDMSKEDEKELNLMKTTPSSALGSVRYKLKHYDEDDTDYQKLLEVFKKYNIRYFFYNGGNDSMDTCNKVSKFMQQSGYECRVMGVPKTIDNDLFGTDHCPGYGSAAKYIATSTMEVSLDARVYDTPMITVLEIMGRNAGWLTAASAIAGKSGLGPDLIYLPEIHFDMDKLLQESLTIFEKNKKVVIAVSEGAKTKEGKYIAEMGADLSKDSFGHSQLGGTASILAGILKKETSAKVRGIEFSLLQRCAAHVASKTDIEESYLAGQMAVKYAIEGKSDYMVGFEREDSSEYKCNIKLINLSDVANTEKIIPREWINEAGNNLNEEFFNYVSPLIAGESKPPFKNGVPRFAKLKKISVK